MRATQPIRSKKQVSEFLAYFKKQGHNRNWVLAALCLHTALRVSDVLSISTNDVYDFDKRTVRSSITIVEGKTKKNKTVVFHKNLINALKAYMPESQPGQPLVLNKLTGKAISRVQAHRLISEAAKSVGIEENVSCHSLRKTFGYHAWKEGTSPAIIMEIYNHSSLAVTRRYLGVAQSDMNEVYSGLNF